MSNITIMVVILFLALWIYSISSIYTREFNNDKEKVFWRIGIIFVPLLAFFYIFMKNRLHND